MDDLRKTFSWYCRYDDSVPAFSGTRTDRMYMDEPNIEELEDYNTHTARPESD
jgi:hypothetical protein